MFNFIKNIGPTEVVILLALLTLFFGRRIAIAIGKTTGQTVKEIKGIKKELMSNVEGLESKKS